MARGHLSITAIPDIPLIEPGDDLAAIVEARIRDAGLWLQDLDVVAITQKIVSKAENRYIFLDEVEPTQEAIDLAAELALDARKVEIVLRESTCIVRKRRGILITQHRLGLVMANAGVDESNISQQDGRHRVLRLPQNPDRTCRDLKRRWDARFSANIGVVMTDTFGRPLRNGVVGVAIGAAGLPSLCSLVGEPDLAGRPLQGTESAFADEIASAASLLMGQAAEGLPVVLVRGLHWHSESRPALDLARPREQDMFR